MDLGLSGKKGIVCAAAARSMRICFVTFATESEDIDAELLLHLARDGMNVITDQSHRAGRIDRNRLSGCLRRFAEHSPDR